MYSASQRCQSINKRCFWNGFAQALVDNDWLLHWWKDFGDLHLCICTCWYIYKNMCIYIYIYAYSSYVGVCFIVAICRTDLACPADPDIVFRLPGLPGESHRGISSENPGAVSVTVFSLGEGWVFQAAACVCVFVIFFMFFPSNCPHNSTRKSRETRSQPSFGGLMT